MRLRCRAAVASWRVSVQQGTSGGQPISDGVDRVIHPGRAEVLDAEQRQDQQGCVQISGAVAGVPLPTAGSKPRTLTLAARASLARCQRRRFRADSR